MKYVLETGSNSTVYIGMSIDNRMLFDTYEAAKAEYDRILSENYNSYELEELEEDYEGLCNGDANYSNDWTDEDLGLYLRIYEVSEVR